MKTDMEVLIGRAEAVQAYDKLMNEKEKLKRELKVVNAKLRKTRPQTLLGCYDMPKLKAAADACLIDGDCLSSDLAQACRQWRYVIADLKHAKRRQFAEDVLAALNVSYFDGEHNARRFFRF